MGEVKRYTVAGDINVWVAVEGDRVYRISFGEIYGDEPMSTIWKRVDDFFEVLHRREEIHGIPFPIPPVEENYLRFLLHLQRIPIGNVKSYGEVAEEFFGNRKYARVVGNYLARNRWPLVFPCHRVVRSDGSPGGFTGGRETKVKLLEWEKEGRK